ncbi:hypothetical protein [Paenibacillus agricola]|uniref:Uncharacterized protein n=1 Tax=Paenibacillus agricola TaxID=2716264 RepID=A0ABX0JBQ5_9BACL|nr:hypothetical protein [Paenibacillus agricola]NHN33383.1 hypothetical protein [Paenibacillus agricola]
MKLVLKIGVSLMLLFLVFSMVYRVTLMGNPFAIQNKTSAFLKAVQVKQYEEAAQLFGSTADKKTLAQGLLKLHEEGFRLLSYDKVNADYDDDSFSTGHAELTFEVDGNPMKVRAILTFSPEAKPKQVCPISPSEIKRGSIPQLEAWNQLFCGGSF